MAAVIGMDVGRVQSARRAGAGRAEWCFTLLALLVFVSLPFVVGDQPQGAESLNPVDMLKMVSNTGDQLKQVILLGMYASFAALLVSRERARALLFLGGPMLLLLLWTVASASWSVNPEVTLRRAVALFGTVGMGLYLGLRFDLRRLLVLLCWAGLAALGLSLLLAVAAPSLGLDFEGRLRGVTAHKNGIAGFAAIVFLAGCGLLASGSLKRSTRMLAVAAMGLATGCMALAHSTSVIPVLGLALATLAFGRTVRRASGVFLAFLPLLASLALLAAGFMAANSGAVAELLGKDANLSGRTLVWAFSAKMILLRPVAGYGLGAFWVGENSPGAMFWSTSHIGVPHAHNGFIQLGLELGFVGLALFAAAILAFAVRLTWLVRHGRDPLCAWPLAFLTFDLMANYSETWLWIGNELLTVFLVAVLVHTNVLYRAASLRASRIPFMAGVAR